MVDGGHRGRPDGTAKLSEKQMALLGLYLVSFTTALGMQTLVTLIPQYAIMLEASPYWIGMFTTSFALAGTVVVLPIGWLADRIGKMVILRYGLLISIASYILFLFVISAESFALARAIQGVGVTAAMMTALSLVAEIAGQHERGRVIGTFNAIRNLSGALGSVAAGWLFVQYGFLVPNVVLIVVTASAWLLLVRRRGAVQENMRAPGFTFGPLLKSKAVQAMAAFRILYGLGQVMTRTFIPIYAGVTLGFTAFQVGIIIAADQTVSMALQRFTGGLSDRFGRLPMVTAGGVGFALSVLMVPLQTALYPLVAVNLLLGAWDAVREPASMALFADEGNRTGGIASAFALRQMLWRPGMVLAPMIGGAIMAAAGIEMVFLASFGIVGLAVLGLRLTLRRQRSQKTLVSQSP